MSNILRLRQFMLLNGKLSTLLLLISLFAFSSLAYAGMGVFNPHITPDEILTNSATNITVYAEVGTDVAHPLIQSSVVLYETDATGKPIRSVGRMYDDGTHGDVLASDTIFTLQFPVNETALTKKYFKVTAAYTGVRNRYQSTLVEYVVYPPLPQALVPSVTQTVQYIQSNFNNIVASQGLQTAQQLALQDALNNPNIGPGNAAISGNNLAITYKYTDPSTGYQFNIPGIIFLSDPQLPSDGAGRSVPTNLPSNYVGPGNDKLLIFAPGYNNADPQRGIADHAQSQFTNTEFMTFSPNPTQITMDGNASLELIKHWGDYGTVVMHTHGGLWSNQVVLLSGTQATAANQTTYQTDLQAGRLGIAGDGRYVIFPSFITRYATPMKNTVFYLGACESLMNDTMWDALRAKGAKVAFGWSETVARTFNTLTFASLFDPMLPHLPGTVMTAKQSFDNVNPKTDPWGGRNATLTMRTASADWEQFVFAEGGIVNGDFETGDFTGWTHSADPDNLYGYVTAANTHTGSFAAVLGRWDTAFSGYNPTLEPYGNEWIYQDFVVPSNASKLSFWWFMETYDTAVWDWFDAKIQNPATGTVLKDIVYHGGKPGSNFGPYWNSGNWQYVETDVTAYRGQKIRIYFGQRLDGWGDQTRTFIDDVKVN